MKPSFEESTGNQPIAALETTETQISQATHSESLVGKRLLVGFLPGYATNRKRGFDISDVPGDKLTHLIYGFAGFRKSSGLWLPATPEPKDIRKNFVKLKALKETYPMLWLMVSIGGWNNSHVMDGANTVWSQIISTEETREAFVSSCIDLFFRDSPVLFDGFDLDWEYPRPNSTDQANLWLLVQEFRHQLNVEGANRQTRLPLSLSVNKQPELYTGAAESIARRDVDWLNLMAYNMHMSKSGHRTDFNCPLYAPGSPLSDDAFVSNWLAAGVPPTAIALGIDAYAQSYANVPPANNGLYQEFSGLGPGTWGAGILNYRHVVSDYLPTCELHWDDTCQSSYIYCPSTHVWISPQLPRDAQAKAAYAISKNLAGLMLWEVGADTTGTDSLVTAMHSSLPGLRREATHRRKDEPLPDQHGKEVGAFSFSWLWMAIATLFVIMMLWYLIR
jgi:chitinase